MHVERVRVNSVELAFEESGSSGDPLVLVHGSWVDHHIWSLVAPRLAESFRVLQYDRRGYGGSERGLGPYGIQQDVEDLAALLESRDHFPAHVVGTSLGGSVALRLAVSRPELLRGVVVHEPPLFGLLDPGSEDVRAFRAASDDVAARVGAGDVEAAARRFVELLESSPGGWERLSPESQVGLARNAVRWLDEYSGSGMFDIDRAELRAFDPPVLVTSGSLSPPVYARIADRLSDTLPNAVRRRLEGTGHVPQATDPGLYASALFDFCLERHVPTS
jgi:pimeloyl-ACP methyl ester carboxylesterase